MNKDGLETSVEVEHKCMPAKGTWEGKAEFKIGGYGNDTVSSWSEVQFDTDSSKDHKLTVSNNILCEKKYHTAFKVVSSLSKKKVSEAYALMAFNDLPFGDMWLRGNILEKIYAVGMSASQDGHHHSAELQYDAGNAKNEGLMGKPLFLRYGGVYNLSNKTKFQLMMNVGKQWWITEKWEVPLDDKFKMTMNTKFDLLQYPKGTVKESLQAGFGVEMKL